MSLRQQLQSIYEARGELTPPVVLEEARPEDSPLHDRFEWDDEVAGEAFRLMQAHELIRSVKVTFTRKNGSKDSVRAFHAIRQDDSPQPSYLPVDEVLDDPMTRAILLADMKREWMTLKRRYERFGEFIAMVRRDVADVA